MAMVCFLFNLVTWFKRLQDENITYKILFKISFKMRGQPSFITSDTFLYSLKSFVCYKIESQIDITQYAELRITLF